jgi:hypothetical protein
MEMDPAIIAVCGVIAAVWAIGKTASAVRTLRDQRRNSSDGFERESGNGGGVGGIDPGGSDCNGGHGHGGGDCGGHGGGW